MADALSTHNVYVLMTCLLWALLVAIMWSQRKRLLRLWASGVMASIVWIPASNELLTASYLAAHPVLARGKDQIAYAVTRGIIGLGALGVALALLTGFTIVCRHLETTRQRT